MYACACKMVGLALDTWVWIAVDNLHAEQRPCSQPVLSWPDNNTTVCSIVFFSHCNQTLLAGEQGRTQCDVLVGIHVLSAAVIV